MPDVTQMYAAYMARRHRPAHRRRRAEQWAAYLLPHLRTDMRVLDLGCGPGSITIGLPGRVIGLDVEPVAVDGVPVVRGDGSSLPFRDASFDAVHMNAVLQHVVEASAVLREVRRVVRSGAVVGVGDADWGTRVMHPHDARLVRGQEIQEMARIGGNVRVGRELRGLLVAAGLDVVQVDVQGRVVASPLEVARLAAFEGSWFEAPEAVDYVVHIGISTADEMAQIAAAWREWSEHPAAVATDSWFTAVAHRPEDHH